MLKLFKSGAFWLAVGVFIIHQLERNCSESDPNGMVPVLCGLRYSHRIRGRLLKIRSYGIYLSLVWTGLYSFLTVLDDEKSQKSQIAIEND